MMLVSTGNPKAIRRRWLSPIGFPGDDGFPFFSAVLAAMARPVRRELQYDRARPTLLMRPLAGIRHLGRHMPQFGRAASLRLRRLHEDAKGQSPYCSRNG